MAEEDTNALPPILIQRRTQFNFPFKTWLQTRFRLLDPAQPNSLAQSVRVLVCFGPATVTAELLERYPSIELVVGSSTGINHVDLAECRRRGVKVCNAGDAFSEDVADLAVGLLIDVLRRVSAGDRFLRAGLWPVQGDYRLGSKEYPEPQAPEQPSDEHILNLVHWSKLEIFSK